MEDLIDRLVKSLVMIGVILFLLSFDAKASSVYVGGLSVHMNEPPDHVEKWNNTNYFLGFEHNNFVGGAFYNSFEDWTVFGGYKVRVMQAQLVDFDLNLGLMYGYDPKDNDFLNMNGFQPMIAPEVKFNTPYIQPVVMFTGSAMTLIFKYEF